MASKRYEVIKEGRLLSVVVSGKESLAFWMDFEKWGENWDTYFRPRRGKDMSRENHGVGKHREYACSHIYHFCHIVLVTQTNLDSARGYCKKPRIAGGRGHRGRIKWLPQGRNWGILCFQCLIMGQSERSHAILPTYQILFPSLFLCITQYFQGVNSVYVQRSPKCHLY